MNCARMFLIVLAGSGVHLGELDYEHFSTDESGRRAGVICPTGALLGEAAMRLSYQTQTKGFMPQVFRKIVT